jgi:hypothetical protein
MIALASPSSPAAVIRSRQNWPANASGSLITSLLRHLSRKHVASAAEPLSVTGYYCPFHTGLRFALNALATLLKVLRSHALLNGVQSLD